MDALELLEAIDQWEIDGLDILYAIFNHRDTIADYFKTDTSSWTDMLLRFRYVTARLIREAVAWRLEPLAFQKIYDAALAFRPELKRDFLPHNSEINYHFDAALLLITAFEDQFRGTSESESTVPPLPLSKVADAESVAARYDALILALHKKAPTRGRLLRFMKDRNRAEIQDAAEAVHGNARASDGAISKNIQRVNEELTLARMPVRFELKHGWIEKICANQ